MPEEPATSTTPDLPVRVVIDFDPGLEIAGSVRGTDTSTKFQGRLELYAAIERARELAPSPPDA